MSHLDNKVSVMSAINFFKAKIRNMIEVHNFYSKLFRSFILFDSCKTTEANRSALIKYQSLDYIIFQHSLALTINCDRDFDNNLTIFGIYIS